MSIQKRKSKTKKENSINEDLINKSNDEYDDVNDPSIDPKISPQFAKELLNESLRRYQTNIEKERKYYKEINDSLMLILSEYLTDFIIIGHTVDDQRVYIKKASTPGDVDKLLELSRQVLYSLINIEQQD